VPSRFIELSTSGSTRDMALSKSGAGTPVSRSSSIASIDPKRVDLVFAMDCTGSMGGYIKHSQDVCQNYVSL